MPHALIVDDDLSFRLGIAEVVNKEGFTTATASTLAEARTELQRQTPDVLLTDLQLPDGSGLSLLPEVEEANPEIILVTGHASVETAVDALRLGVTDYLSKPVDLARIKTVLANVSRTRELKREIGTLRTELRKLGRFGALIGASPAMQKVYDLIGKVAPTNASILITGETGSGKELVALTVHEQSRRHREPFRPVNCGAVSPNLIESELFGHEKGSFTGAERAHRGYFEQANRGTLFLDEITEMPQELQVKLLRVLETGAVRRIGGTEAIQVDARVIAATNRLPEDAVQQGKLRDDLLYRLNVFPIFLPPLRERGDDVVLLADHFLAAFNKEEGTQKLFSEESLDRLRRHHWPGNVRELRNTIHRSFILAEETIDVDDLPAPVRSADGSPSTVALKVGVSLSEAERRLIVATLESCGSDKKRTAEVLGISLKTLYNRLNEYRAAAEATHS
jgi:DNA-binding NtrC family response regulator